MIAFELKRQYPEMEVTVVEMKNVVKLAEEKFVPGNEDLEVKFMSGTIQNLFYELNAYIFINCKDNIHFTGVPSF